jgi:hypothetical protein
MAIGKNQSMKGCNWRCVADGKGQLVAHNDSGWLISQGAENAISRMTPYVRLLALCFCHFANSASIFIWLQSGIFEGAPQEAR